MVVLTKKRVFSSILSSTKQGKPSAHSLMNRASVCSNTYRSKAQYAETALRRIYNLLWLPLCVSCWENELSANSSASTWSLKFGQNIAHIKDSQASVWAQWKSGKSLTDVEPCRWWMWQWVGLYWNSPQTLNHIDHGVCWGLLLYSQWGSRPQEVVNLPPTRQRWGQKFESFYFAWQKWPKRMI